MLVANQGAIGFFSKVRNERRRVWRIQSGSPFHHEICSTTPSLRPFSGVNAYSASSLQPSEYLVRSRSNEVIFIYPTAIVTIAKAHASSGSRVS